MRVLHVTTGSTEHGTNSFSQTLSDDDAVAWMQVRTFADMARDAIWEVKVQDDLRGKK